MNDKQGTDARVDLNKKLFIGGVPRTVSDEEYREYFSSFGELDDCILMRDSSGVCRGFGFVTYKNQSSYDDVFKADLQLRGKKLEQKKAVPPTEMDNKNNEVKIFVGGLSQDVDKSELDEHFSHFGKIEDSVVMMDAVSGKSRGFGFVTFADSSSVNEIMENPKFELCGKEVQCKRALPKKSSNRMSRENSRGSGYGYYRRGGRGDYNDRVTNRTVGSGRFPYGDQSYGRRDCDAVGFVGSGGYRRQQVPADGYVGDRNPRYVDEGLNRRDMFFERQGVSRRVREVGDYNATAVYPKGIDCGNHYDDYRGGRNRYQPY